jgi:Flp pilus assembly protein TadD
VQELLRQRRAIPRRILDAVTAVADAWRAKDSEDWRPCWLAGRILCRAGERDLAWGHLTSPASLQYGDAEAWIELARQMHWEDEYVFAERAFAVADSLKPKDAQIARERKLNHRTAGRNAP